MFCIDCCAEIMDLIYNMNHSTSHWKTGSHQLTLFVCVCVCAYMNLVSSIIWSPEKPINWTTPQSALKFKVVRDWLRLSSASLSRAKLLIKIYVYGFNSSFIALCVYKRKGVNATWHQPIARLNGIIRNERTMEVGQGLNYAIVK